MMYNQRFVAVIKSGGRILRERHNGTVYLPFGKEYSILLKNKDARKVLVDIEVDGKNVLNGHKLIMDGNETQEIMGIMKNMSVTNRFRFINKTKEIQNHRGDRIDDGLVRITYQFEEHKRRPVTINWCKTPYRPPYDSTDDTRYTGDVLYTCSTNDIVGSVNDTAKGFSPRSDEGITVKGSKVNSNYRYGDVGDLEPSVYTIVLQLKGRTKKSKKIVSKPITVKTRLKCDTCGRKNKSVAKFCYNCGTYLD